MPQATATLSRSTIAAIAGTAAAMPDIIATLNTSGRITTVVRPITAIICPITALIGPAAIGRVTGTIGRITAIIGALTATLRFTGITSGRVSDLEPGFISASNPSGSSLNAPSADVVFVMSPSHLAFASSVLPPTFAYAAVASTAVPPTRLSPSMRRAWRRRSVPNRRSRSAKTPLCTWKTQRPCHFRLPARRTR
jgi:hypothetical protein